MSKSKYSVSLVFEKIEDKGIDYAQRVMITDAVSEHEAIGIAYSHFRDKLKGYSLFLETTIKIEP